MIDVNYNCKTEGCKNKRYNWNFFCKECIKLKRRQPCPNCNEFKNDKRAKLCKKCSIKALRGSKHPCWKGGKIKDTQGYTRIYTPKDPRANCGRYLKEHTIVMEKFLGRQLTKYETIHHKNGNRTDNRIENLELWDKSHPYGQRVEDKLKWAVDYIQQHQPKLLNKKEFKNYGKIPH